MSALWTQDFVEVAPDGATFDYEQFQRMFLAIDGEHPEEFMLTIMVWNSRGKFKTPTSEQMERIREAARDPSFLRTYKEWTPQWRENFKADQALQLKTMKVVGIEVDGDAATARIELDSKTQEGIRHYAGTISLRKVGGKWMICKSVFEYK